VSLLKSQDETESERILEQVKGETTFVMTSVLTEMSRSLVKIVAKDEGIASYRYDALERKAREELNWKQDLLDTVLVHLESNKRAKVTLDTGIKIVKFGDNPEFTELEVGLVRLESAKELIEAEIKKCELSMEELREEARESLKQNNKTRAKFLLKKKKRIENQISKKETQLDNVEFLLEQLLDSDSHKSVFEAYQKGAEALRVAQLKPDDVEKTMDEFEDTLQAQNELVAEVGKAWRVRDEDQELELDLDLEEELSSILQEEEQKEEKKKKMTVPSPSLPEPPLEGPSDEELPQDQQLQELMDRLQRLKRGYAADEDTPKSKNKPLPAV
jgi:charged multivesicular body protein 6